MTTSASFVLRDHCTNPIGVSCPAKVILFGEHSVVYGKRAIALSIDLRNRIYVNFKENEDLVAEFPSLDLNVSWNLTTLQKLFDGNVEKGDIARHPQSYTPQNKDKYDQILSGANYNREQRLCLHVFLHLFSNILIHPVAFVLRCESDIPLGGGLGSSAGFAVSLSAVLLKVSSQVLGNPTIEKGHGFSPELLETICRWAFVTEKILHGTPSGIDNSICTFGGGISFKSGKMDKINVVPLNVLLVNTGVSRSTKILVEKVRMKYNKYPSVIQPILAAMDNLAETACDILCQDYSENASTKLNDLEDLINLNHSMLRTLDVSHPSLEKIISIASSFGMSAKLTGAGGGGFAVILCQGKEQHLIENCKKSLEEHGFDSWEAKLGAPGVTEMTEFISKD